MKYVGSSIFLIIYISLFTPAHFANFTHYHEETKSIVDDGQLPEYFNIFSPVGRRDNKYIAYSVKRF